MAEVPGADAGLASVIVNASLQISAAIGIAALGTVAAHRTKVLAGLGEHHLQALTGGFHLASGDRRRCRRSRRADRLRVVATADPNGRGSRSQTGPAGQPRAGGGMMAPVPQVQVRRSVDRSRRREALRIANRAPAHAQPSRRREARHARPAARRRSDCRPLHEEARRRARDRAPLGG